MNLVDSFFKHAIYLPVARYQAGDVAAQLSLLMKSETDGHESIRAIQEQRLRQLLQWAHAEIPYYQNRLRDLDLAEATLDLLPSIQPLTKSDLQQDAARLRTRNAGRFTTKTTGGSTGEALTLWKDRPAWCHELAATWRGYAWAGIDIGKKQARFWGTPLQGRHRRRAQLIDFVCRRRRYSAFDFTPQTIGHYIDDLIGYRPHYLYGYVSMLVEVADEIIRRGLELDGRIQCAIATSEVLTQGARETISRAFSTQVFNEYGCGEIGTIAHECEYGNMHISEENMVVEILDGDRVCGPDEPGEIVITELNNRAMPLIRYRMGDFGYRSSTRCKCGRSLAILGGIHGRAYDFIVNSQGKKFHGEFIMYVFEEIKASIGGFRQFQVVQETPTQFLVRLVPDTDDGPRVEEAVLERIRERVDADAKVTFQRVESIPRERSGKMRLIKGLASPTPAP